MVVPARLVEHLLHAGEQEHLVVHRQAEDDGEHEHGDDGPDRLRGALEAEHAGAVAVLEHEHREPERRAHR